MMITKRFFVISLLTVTLCFSNVYVYAGNPTCIELQVGYVDPNDGKDGEQKSPILIPQLSIDGSYIIFDTICDGCVLRLLDEDGNVVYTTIIPTGSTTLVLPSNLSGEYEIQIIRGNFCFWGYIIL